MCVCVSFIVFQQLSFQVNAPTSILFLRRFSKASNADAITHSMAKYFIESASIDYSLSEFLPTEVSDDRFHWPAFAIFLIFLYIKASFFCVYSHDPEKNTNRLPPHLYSYRCAYLARTRPTNGPSTTNRCGPKQSSSTPHTN